MNVVVMLCALNEEKNIERFCEVYSRIADVIVVCDGGSTDRTVELARAYPKVEVIQFATRDHFDGIPSNPLGPMHNFAYTTVLTHNPDWIITDECDSIPTLHLRQEAREEMALSRYDVIGAMRIYVVGENEYYPDLSMKGFFGWAHRPDKVDGRYGETKYAGIPRPNFPVPDSGQWNELPEPYCLLHYGWPDEDVVEFKTRRYRANGALPKDGTPIPPYAGTPESLPEWAKWN